MRTRIGAYLAEQRRAQHLNTHQLAAALGLGTRSFLAWNDVAVPADKQWEPDFEG